MSVQYIQSKKIIIIASTFVHETNEYYFTLWFQFSINKTNIIILLLTTNQHNTKQSLLQEHEINTLAIYKHMPTYNYVKIVYTYNNPRMFNYSILQSKKALNILSSHLTISINTRFTLKYDINICLYSLWSCTILIYNIFTVNCLYNLINKCIYIIKQDLTNILHIQFICLISQHTKCNFVHTQELLSLYRVSHKEQAFNKIIIYYKINK